MAGQSLPGNGREKRIDPLTERTGRLSHGDLIENLLQKGQDVPVSSGFNQPGENGYAGGIHVFRFADAFRQGLGQVFVFQAIDQILPPPQLVGEKRSFVRMSDLTSSAAEARNFSNWFSLRRSKNFFKSSTTRGSSARCNGDSLRMTDPKLSATSASF